MHNLKKRYLLKEDITTLINDLELKSNDISEFYTIVKVCKEVRFSKVDSNYNRIVKTGVIGSKVRMVKKIKKSKYYKEEKNLLGHKIEKKRYIVPDELCSYAIDKFEKPFKKLYLLEVSFKDKKALNDYKLPDIFKVFVIKDVSNDKRYQEKNLALLGDPKKSSYNIYTIFKDIELGRIENINKILFGEMKTSDAVRIVLYRLFIQLRLSKDAMAIDSNVTNIKNIDIALKKSIILLKENMEIFDRQIAEKVLTHLKTMKKSLKNYKNLQFISKEVKQMAPFFKESELKKIQTSILEKKAEEEHKISQFLQTREFAIVFKQYELLLKETSKSQLSVDAQTSINKTLQDKIFLHCEKTALLCDKYEGCRDIKTYKILKKPFDVLKVLFEEFDMIIDKKSYKESYKNIISIKKQIKQINNINKKKMIITTYLDNLDKKPKDYSILKKSINHESEISIKKKIHSLQKSIEQFKKQNSLFN